MRFHRRAQTERFTCQQTQPYATVTMNREIISFVMRKCGSGFFLSVRKRYPRLDRMNFEHTVFLQSSRPMLPVAPVIIMAESLDSVIAASSIIRLPNNRIAPPQTESALVLS